MIKAKNGDLRSFIGGSERLAEWCVLAIVGGLVLEILLAIYALPRAWDRAGLVLANSLIALGVYGELRFSKRGNAAQSELTRRSNEKLGEAITLASAANERAAEANEHAAVLSVHAEYLQRQLEELVEPRILGERKHKLVAALAANADILSGGDHVGHVHIGAVQDVEALQYASQILAAFREAGVRVSQEQPYIVMQYDLEWTDLLVVHPPASDQPTKGLAKALGMALILAGFRSRGVEGDISPFRGVILAVTSKQKPASMRIPQEMMQTILRDLAEEK